MLQSLPFDQPVAVVSLKRTVAPNTITIRRAPNIAEIQRHMSSLAPQEVWPVAGPNSTVAAITTKRVEEKQSTEIDQLARLKIAALVAILSQHVICFVCNESGTCAQQLMNQTEFDFQSALVKRTVYERELSNYRKISHCNLVQAFKTILSKLLERFYGANESRFDQVVLNFVALTDAKALQTQFSYTDHQLMLAKQYVYSALYDGQLLQFDSTALEIYCARMQMHEDNLPEEKTATVVKQKSLLQKAIAKIQERTAQIFQRHKLFNQLIAQCVGKNCHEQMKPTLAQLSSLTDKGGVWNLLQTSPLEYEGMKSITKATILCDSAFTSRSEKTCKQLEECGFFNDPKLLANLLDNGSLEKIRSNETRQMLLNKAVAVDDISVLLGSDTKTLFKRALWLLSLTVVKLSKKEQQNFVVESAFDDANAKELLKQIYEWLKKHDTPKQYQTHRKRIESFLLRLKQYNLLLVL